MSEAPNKRLKVLALCSWYPNRTNTTLGNFVQKHAEAAGIYNNVIVLTLFSDPKISTMELQEQTKNGITEIIVYYPKSNGTIPVFNKFSNMLAQRKAFKKGYAVVRQKFGTPDITHLNIVYPMGIWALWLKKKYGIPYVITENSSGFHVGSTHAYPPAVLRLCTRILRNASRLMPVSQNLMGHLKKLAPDAQFSLISNVVDEELFTVQEHTPSPVKRLIHISTGIDSIKNLTGMIRVINKLGQVRSDLHLDIVSDGDIEYAKNLAKTLACTHLITFHATKTTEEVAQMIGESDALLMFSNYENFPCVIAESFMSGLPVISSNVNGIPEHVNEMNGILVNRGAEDELEAAIVRFLDGTFNYDRQVIRAYAEKHFGYKSVGKEFDAVYREVLKKS